MDFDTTFFASSPFFASSVSAVRLRREKISRRKRTVDTEGARD
jgi:hypothetical protein